MITYFLITRLIAVGIIVFLIRLDRKKAHKTTLFDIFIYTIGIVLSEVMISCFIFALLISLSERKGFQKGGSE